MDISLFLTPQNTTAEGKSSGGFGVPVSGDALGGLNASGFFGALVESIDAANFAATPQAPESITPETLSTTVTLAEDSDITPSSILTMSGEELLKLLETSIPDDQQDNFEIIKAGENSLSLSIKAPESEESIAFILNGFFLSGDNVGDFSLEDYQTQISDELRSFLVKAQDLVSSQGEVKGLLAGYTPEEMTKIGDEIASILVKLSEQNEEIDDVELAFALHDKHTAETEVRLRVEAEAKKAQEIEDQKDFIAEEAAEAVVENINEEIAQEVAALESIIQGLVALQIPQPTATVLSNTAQPISAPLVPSISLEDFAHSQYRGASGGDADMALDAELSADLGKRGVGKDALQNIAPSSGDNNAKTTPEFTQLLSNLTNLSPALMSSGLYTEASFDQLGLNLNGAQPMAQMGFTSALTQAQSSAHAHPATNLVSATIKKAAVSGEAKQITIQLDPAELGRVEVKMEFGENKALKAVITAEKPETFMMMQRDASTLERALQQAGLDTQGGLSFELAEHGFDFDQHNRRGGGHDQGGTGAGGEQAAEDTLIETEMTWRVDPESGHMRYNIWA